MKGIYIDTDKKLELIIKTFKLNISKEYHDQLVCELYKHVEHTRRLAYYNGYEQGKFDEYANQLQCSHNHFINE